MKKLKLLSLVLAMLMVVSFAFTGCTSSSSSEKESNGNESTPVVDDSTYTYRSAVNSLPTAWNSHTYQSNDATTVTGYTTDSLYTFDYNDTKDGYQIVPAMATDFPTDVTAEYVGKYGIEEGDENRVYSIPLRDDLKFDNGDPITAQTFVDSMKRLLNPTAANFRADSYFSGNLVIYNAEKYALQGTYAYNVMISEDYLDEEYVAIADLIVNDDGKYVTADGKDVMYNVRDGGSWSSNSLVDYANAGYLNYVTDEPEVDEEGNPVLDDEGNPVYKTDIIPQFMNLYNAEKNDKGYIHMTPALVEDLMHCVAILHGCASVEDYANAPTKKDEEGNVIETVGDYAYLEWEEFCYYGAIMDYTLDFEEVGFFADGNNLIVVNAKELSGFYLKYSLSTDFFLIHPETYDDCEGESQGIYTNNYGTSVETYVGFGPYMLDQYVSGSIVTFKKNPHWYGYNDAANEGHYQTTNIVIQQVPDAESRLEMFLQGKLDAYGLQAADMADYQSSDFTYYTEGDSTWFVALNPSMSGLESAQATATEKAGYEVNKTILTIKEFRQALSFSVDRAAYALRLDPLGGTAKALYGNMIISDPENGVAYRTTEQAKDVILNFWGLADQVGEGKRFATKDEAIESITGYDLAGAKELFNAAYDKAVADGLITDTANFKVELVIGQPGSGSSAYYNNGYEFLKEVWEDAVTGTKLEGKLTFTQSAPLGSTNFSDYLKNNTVDILFGVGWTGSALDPYGLMEAYVAPDYQYDPGWDTATTSLDIELTIDGETKVLRASVYDWGKDALSGKDIIAYVVGDDGMATDEEVVINAGANADAELRLNILAAVEGAVLQQYDMIPINLDSSAALKGMKIKYGTEEYVFGVGRGGIKYMTYLFDDEAWDAYVKAQGGELNYK